MRMNERMNEPLNPSGTLSCLWDAEHAPDIIS